MIVSPIKLFLRSGRSLHFMWASYKSTVLHLSLVYPPFLSVFSYKFAGCIKLSIPSQAIAKNDRVADGIKTVQSLSSSGFASQRGKFGSSHAFILTRLEKVFRIAILGVALCI